MKMLFKIYLLGQLIALPFMIGAMGNAFSGSEPSSSSGSSGSSGLPQIESVSNLGGLSNEHLCASPDVPALNPVHDNFQQLRLVTADLYGEDVAADCFDTPTR